MQIRVLLEFISLVETCSFQETAAKMNISQSSLTKHIQKLEEELGASLFIRSQHSVKVSEHGREYLPYAKQLVQLHADSIAALKRLNDQGKNVLSIVFNPILGQYGLIDMIEDFSSKYPRCQLQTFERYHTLDLMKNSRCDFAFTDESEIYDSGYHSLIFRTDHLSIVVRADHPLASQNSITLEQLTQEPFIIHSATMDALPIETRKFQELCSSYNFTPNIVADSKYTSTIIRYVKAGRGIAVLNRMHIHHDLTGLRVIDLYPAVNSYIYLHYPKKLSSPCAMDFLRYITGQCK